MKKTADTTMGEPGTTGTAGTTMGTMGTTPEAGMNSNPRVEVRSNDKGREWQQGHHNEPRQHTYDDGLSGHCPPKHIGMLFLSFYHYNGFILCYYSANKKHHEQTNGNK
jgi:hypothetical protein